MPLIEVRALESRITDETATALIARLTEALGDVLGAAAAEQTWVVVEGVPAGRWGSAGKPLTPPR